MKPIVEIKIRIDFWALIFILKAIAITILI
jgi:hypothetical protein